VFDSVTTRTLFVFPCRRPVVLRALRRLASIVGRMSLRRWDVIGFVLSLASDRPCDEAAPEATFRRLFSAVVIRMPGQRMGSEPERTRCTNRVDTRTFPRGGFVPGSMNLAMVATTERDSKFVANLAR
jgi:hypothetical protein